MPQITLNSSQVKALSDFAHKHDLKTFFLAKDQGAYVGATAGKDETFENIIFYFRGMDPNKDEDFYDNADWAFGGDDFGEHLSVEFIHKMALKVQPRVTIKVTATAITMNGTFKKEAAPKTVAPAPAKKMNKGARIRHLLSLNVDENTIVKTVGTTINSIRWHKSQMAKAA